MPEYGATVTVIKLLDEKAIQTALILSKLGFSYQFIMLKLEMMGYYIPERNEKTGEVVEIKFH